MLSLFELGKFTFKKGIFFINNCNYLSIFEKLYHPVDLIQESVLKYLIMKLVNDLSRISIPDN